MKIKKLKNINSSKFKVNSNTLVINRNESVEIYNIVEDSIFSVPEKNSIATLIINENFLIALKDTLTSVIYSEELKRLGQLDYVLTCWNGLENLSTDKYIYGRIRTKNNVVYAKVSKNNYALKEVFNIDETDSRFYSVLKEDIFLMDNKKMIQTVDINQNNLWQRRYSSLTGVEQNYVSSTILENNAKLYIAISSEGRSGLFVLDIATGEEVAFYEDTFDFLVKDEQYIYTYKGDFCILKIDTQTNQVEEIPLKEVLLSNGFNPNHDLRKSTVKDNVVYFTQYRPNVKLGIIDLATKEMLYKYDFAEENGLIGSIEVSNGRVFVHTQDNTLHIFERER